MNTKHIRYRSQLAIILVFCTALMEGCPNFSSVPHEAASPESLTSSVKKDQSKASPRQSMAERESERERLEKISDETPGLWGFKHLYPSAKGFESTPSSGQFYLNLHDHTQYEQQLVAEGSLFRELPRQAMLLSARDEFGLLTRDRALREEFPWARGSSKYWPLSVINFVKRDFKATISVIRHQPLGVEVLWTEDHDLGTEDPYGQLARIMERISGEEFSELLVREGFTRVERVAGGTPFSSRRH